MVIAYFQSCLWLQNRISGIIFNLMDSPHHIRGPDQVLDPEKERKNQNDQRPQMPETARQRGLKPDSVLWYSTCSWIIKNILFNQIIIKTSKRTAFRSQPTTKHQKFFDPTKISLQQHLCCFCFEAFLPRFYFLSFQVRLAFSRPIPFLGPDFPDSPESYPPSVARFVGFCPGPPAPAV